ncbi:MAG: hypothetical protein ACM3Y9_15365, partial [Ignavibacteria bacterium]
KLMTSPELAAYRAICAIDGANALGELMDAPTMIETLRAQAVAVNRNDMAQTEAMLMNQATALQSLFSRLTERAMGNDTIAPFEANMRMALRAQAQCRATLETLANLKNPLTIFAKQANVTTGPQQINNGTAGASRARENESQQTKLSGGGNELLPNTSASRSAGATHPALEALGEVDRAEVARG